MTEEATEGDYSVPDTRCMRLISRAAFEVDDYWRVVDILHNRFVLFSFLFSLFLSLVYYK